MAEGAYTLIKTFCQLVTEIDSVCAWDNATSTCRTTLESHICALNAVSFSTDDKLVASTSEENTMRRWDAGTE